MGDDLVKRLRDTGEGDMYLAPYTTKVLIDTAADRIEHLEAALREIACDGEDCDCQAPQYCSYGIARLALGEKKDG
jgi:hypothetical protein